jgi:hypothetical protein
MRRERQESTREVHEGIKRLRLDEDTIEMPGSFVQQIAQSATPMATRSPGDDFMALVAAATQALSPVNNTSLAASTLIDSTTEASASTPSLSPPTEVADLMQTEF